MKDKFKLTKLERYWIMLDVGNSAFVLLASTLLPIYFDYLGDLGGLSSAQYLAYWGYATSICTLIVAVLGPILGTVADTKNFKKPLFLASILLGGISCALLGTATHWLAFLAIYIVAKIGCNTSIIFSDAMLTDVTEIERMDTVSSQGYAWGYIGSCIPFGIGLVLVLGGESFGLAMQPAMTITFIIIGLWWLIVSLPLLKNYKQKHFVEIKGNVVGASFSRLGTTFKEIKKEKHIFIFLLAFFFYIDGVYTIIDMATAFGTALGLDSTGLLLALLVTQIVAFPSALAFGRMARKFNNKHLITICISAYTCIAIYAYFLQTQAQFWVLAICVGLFQGAIQALSRSYFAKIIPPEKAGEYFGLFDICGKGASFVGTTLVGVVSQITGSINIGVAVIGILFVIGLTLFRKAVALNPEVQ
ncbi:MAG: MFS transporter [Eubacteriales bacterium]